MLIIYNNIYKMISINMNCFIIVVIMSCVACVLSTVVHLKPVQFEINLEITHEVVFPIVSDVDAD